MLPDTISAGSKFFNELESLWCIDNVKLIFIHALDIVLIVIFLFNWSLWCIDNVKWICILITQVYLVCSITSLYGCMELAVCCFNLVRFLRLWFLIIAGL
jgi:hypothetical protein